MKKLFLSLACLVSMQIAYAQKDSLQLDEGNNYMYYKVVDKPGLSADTLFKRAWDFANTFNTSWKPAKGNAEHTLNASGKFMVYSGVSLVRKESGEVCYTINIQAKDQRYRYRISNFIFKPYQRDRYGNMTVVPGIELPLEKLNSKYSKKEIDNYLDQIGNFCNGIAVNVKQALDKQPITKKAQPVKKISTENW